jgi:hypothetical protein
MMPVTSDKRGDAMRKCNKGQSEHVARLIAEVSKARRVGDPKAERKARSELLRRFGQTLKFGDQFEKENEKHG